MTLYYQPFSYDHFQLLSMRINSQINFEQKEILVSLKICYEMLWWYTIKFIPKDILKIACGNMSIFFLSF